MTFKVGDLVEHDFSGEKSLGIVEEVLDAKRVLVSKRGSGKYTWGTDQCSVLMRNSQWVNEVYMNSGMTPLQNLRQSATDLMNKGVPVADIIGIAYALGQYMEERMSESDHAFVETEKRMEELLAEHSIRVQWFK